MEMSGSLHIGFSDLNHCPLSSIICKTLLPLRLRMQGSVSTPHGLSAKGIHVQHVASYVAGVGVPAPAGESGFLKQGRAS